MGCVPDCIASTYLIYFTGQALSFTPCKFLRLSLLLWQYVPPLRSKEVAVQGSCFLRCKGWDRKLGEKRLSPSMQVSISLLACV